MKQIRSKPKTTEGEGGIGEVAIKAASGLDLPVSDYINGAKSYLGEEVADHVLDDAVVWDPSENWLNSSGTRSMKKPMINNLSIITFAVHHKQQKV